jgi:hypothetical protein
VPIVVAAVVVTRHAGDRLGALTSFLAIAPTPVRVFPILFGEAFCEIRRYQ